MRSGNPSTRRRRKRQLLSTTSLTIDALPLGVDLQLLTNREKTLLVDALKALYALPLPIIDCFDGLVVSWTIGTHPDADLVNTMLDAAIETVAGGSDRPVVHFDSGAHYRWPGWLSRIGDAKLILNVAQRVLA